MLLPTPYKSRWIIEIPNSAPEPRDSFLFTSEDLRQALGEWFEIVNDHDPFHLAIWHTHPGGSIGPSRADLHNRVSGIHHLVVALTDPAPIATFY